MQVDIGYIKSWFGVLKIIEFVSLTIGWSCLVEATRKTYHREFVQNFYLGVNITAWLVVMLWFLAYLFLLCGKINFPNKMSSFSAFHLVCSILLLVSGALLADDAGGLTRRMCLNSSWCEIYDIAAAFGFVSAVIFVIDAFYHWKRRPTED